VKKLDKVMTCFDDPRISNPGVKYLEYCNLDLLLQRYENDFPDLDQFYLMERHFFLE